MLHIKETNEKRVNNKVEPYAVKKISILKKPAFIIYIYTHGSKSYKTLLSFIRFYKKMSTISLDLDACDRIPFYIDLTNKTLTEEYAIAVTGNVERFVAILCANGFISKNTKTNFENTFLNYNDDNSRCIIV